MCKKGFKQCIDCHKKLYNKKTTRCRACSGIASRLDLSGQRFGRLVVLKHCVNKQGRNACVCKCDCGNQVTVRVDGLRTLGTRSCGCLQREYSRTKGRKNSGSFKKGHSPWNNGIKMPEYITIKATKTKKERGVYERMDGSQFIRWYANGGVPWNKGKNIQTNTGKTHFKKGQVPHNYKGGITKTQSYKNYYNRKREVLKKNILGSHSFAEWEALKMKYRYMCLCCKKCEPEITISKDHIIPIALGGTDNLDNLQPLCRSCNSRKHIKTTNYIKQYA